jgi:hypothetical protein
MFIRRYKQIREADGKLEIVALENQEQRERSIATLEIKLNSVDLKYELVATPGILDRIPEKKYSQKPFKILDDNEAFTIIEDSLEFWDILEEAVQLTKVFHIDKYNVGKSQYRFVVAGFENLECKPMGEKESTEIRCRILKHYKNASSIYNYTRINLRNAGDELTFLLPFIGIDKNGANE